MYEVLLELDDLLETLTYWLSFVKNDILTFFYE